jgi:hypothetical protein
MTDKSIEALDKIQRYKIDCFDCLVPDEDGDIVFYDDVKSALVERERMRWQPIETMPLGSHEVKNSHVITINKWGNIHRAYRIHDGTGKYHMHSPYYNEHGQEIHPIGWITLPLAPASAEDLAKLGKGGE